MNSKISFKEIYSSYKRWVISNPNLLTDVETVATWSSYLVAGKINKSPVVSELVYTISKLVSLFNDRLIHEAYGGDMQYGLRDQIKLWLTIVHYSEVFIEIVVKSRWGQHGKWTAASLLQLFKCSSALILLYRFKEVPISHPPIPSLHRKKLTEDNVEKDSSGSFFILRRSGRVVRRVNGSPPAAFRDWQPVTVKDDQLQCDIRDILYAECLHILRPLIHLAAMKVFGTKTWKQWLIALSIDFGSIRLYNKHMAELSHEQRLEVSRRKLGLVLYLMRSPMYNGYSKNVIENILRSMTKKIPAMHFISGPILQYLNYWQDIYFYMWSS